MKKTVNVAIGGCSFVIDEDAYRTIDTYLEDYRTSIASPEQSGKVMDELESRIADLLKAELGSRQVVDQRMAEKVVGLLGYARSTRNAPEDRSRGWREGNPRRLFRDVDSRVLGGVCSGLALYFNIDVVLVRIAFIVFAIMGTAGLWVYLALWLVAPEARTAAEKCEMRGIPATAENMRRFSENREHMGNDGLVENSTTQMRRGVLEYCILLILASGDEYASSIIQKLKDVDIIVAEGTIYPLLIRLKKLDLLTYRWAESTQGPPRKYYMITSKGREQLAGLDAVWDELTRSIETIRRNCR